MSRRIVQAAPMLAVFLLVFPSSSRADPPPLTLAAAIEEARAHNASLPASTLAAESAEADLGAARADRWLTVAMTGDFVYAPPGAYDPALTNLGESRLQLSARQPIFSGGAANARIRQAEATLARSRAGRRAAEADVALDVTSTFAELLASGAELSARRDGLERLRGYRGLLESRSRSGLPVGAELARARLREASDDAALEEAGRRLREASANLNDLLGREDDRPIEPAPLPDPEDVAGATSGEPWNGSPEVDRARQETVIALAGVSLVESERRPHLELAADVGFWGSDTAHPGGSLPDRFQKDGGYSFGVTFSLPLFDLGGYRLRRSSALSLAEAARREETAVLRRARLALGNARSAAGSALREWRILSRAAPEAMDGYLSTESRYRGGAASSLELLDAYGAWIDATMGREEAALRYRVARAVMERWGER